MMNELEHIKHAHYMQQALHEARKAYNHNEVPVGALVVDAQGFILSQAYNNVEHAHTQTAHAEILALEKAGKKRENWRLEGCWLYVTLEPCVMCMGLITLSRLKGVVFGADSLLFGHRLDKHIPHSLYKNDMLEVIAGVEAHESIQLLKKFFQCKRNQCE